ncbi:MAG: 5-(carboxyamino)imidazole ribonucleotide mutase [Methanomassiliicoccales archaeon]
MPSVLVMLGSKSDLEVGQKAVATLKKFGVECKMLVASAHRSPERVKQIVESSDADVFIAVAGVAAALPGVIASLTIKPVIGVPVSGKVNLDAILSIVQMPPGIPVATVGLDRGENAALLALEILAIKDSKIAATLQAYRKEMAQQVEKDSQEVEG